MSSAMASSSTGKCSLGRLAAVSSEQFGQRTPHRIASSVICALVSVTPMSSLLGVSELDPPGTPVTAPEQFVSWYGFDIIVVCRDGLLIVRMRWSREGRIEQWVVAPHRSFRVVVPVVVIVIKTRVSIRWLTRLRNAPRSTIRTIH